MKLLLSISLVTYFSITNLFAAPELMRKCSQTSVTGDKNYAKSRAKAEIYLDGNETAVAVYSQGSKFYQALEFRGDYVHTLSIPDVSLHITYDAKHGNLTYSVKKSSVGIPAVDTLITYYCKSGN